MKSISTIWVLCVYIFLRNRSKISPNYSADQYEDWNNIEKCTSFLWSLTTKWQKMAVRLFLRNLTTKCPKLKFAIKFHRRLDQKNLQDICHESSYKIWTKNSAMSPVYPTMTKKQNIATTRLRPFQISKNKISKWGLMLMLFITKNQSVFVQLQIFFVYLFVFKL